MSEKASIQSTPFVSSTGETRNPIYEGQFDGETLEQAEARRHWAKVAMEMARNAALSAPSHGEQAHGSAAREVLSERSRQITAEGWAAKHDDQYTAGQLADAAACYALWASGINPGNWGHFWPWDRVWLKHSEPRRMLVKAGALILAEIERLDRAAAPSAGSQEVGDGN